jgi:hypothetical protein
MPFLQMMFKNIDIPILFKYRKATPVEEVQRMIQSGELWFSRATSFNDPFDTAITYNFNGLDSDLAAKWVPHAIDKYERQLTEAARRELAAKRLAEIRNDPTYIQRMRMEFIEHNYNSFGICSLSSLNDNILMWGHYAHDHKGLCIGLSVNHLWKAAKQLASSDQVLDLVPILYSDSKPQINFFEAMLANNSDEVQTFYASKSSDWAYENEFRLVMYNRSNFALKFGPELVKQVIFGCRTPESERAAIISFCREHNLSVSFFQASTDESKYKLNISSFD